MKYESIAKTVYDECMKDDCPSATLYKGYYLPTDQDQDYENETTIYMFKDGSKIKDCNGHLEWFAK